MSKLWLFCIMNVLILKTYSVSFPVDLNIQYLYCILCFMEIPIGTHWQKSLGIPDLESIHSTGIQSIASFRNAPSDPKVSEPWEEVFFDSRSLSFVTTNFCFSNHPEKLSSFFFHSPENIKDKDSKVILILAYILRRC